MKTVNYHEALNWLRCRLKWYLSNNYEPKVVRPELTQGTDIHKVLGEYYSAPYNARTLGLLKSLFNQAIAEREALAKGNSKELTRLLLWESKGLELLEKYWETFGQDEEIQDAHIEEEVRVSLAPELNVEVMFHPDLYTVRQVKSSTVLTILDHKTGKDPDIEHLVLFDTQKLVYGTLLWLKLQPDEVHIAYNVMGLQPVKVERVDFQLSKEQMRDTLEWLEKVTIDVGEGNLYRTPSLTCSWDCEFYPFCRVSMADGDAEQVLSDLYIRKGE